MYFNVENQALPPLLDRTRERALSLPAAVLDCEACESDDSMLIRRSSLNKFKADDICLKCTRCRYFRVHGVGLTPEQYAEEVEARRAEYGRLVIDVHDERDKIEATDEALARLEDLGYIVD